MVEQTVNVRCPNCDGYALKLNGNKLEECTLCKGQGFIPLIQQDAPRLSNLFGYFEVVTQVWQKTAGPVSVSMPKVMTYADWFRNQQNKKK